MNKYIRDAVAYVQQYIDKHPVHTKTITELANDARIGRNLLQRAFKALTGCRIKEYQLRKRMELAQTLLDESHLTKKDVARRCGYSSQNSFARYFKKFNGMSPSDWQNRRPVPRKRGRNNK